MAPNMVTSHRAASMGTVTVILLSFLVLQLHVRTTQTTHRSDVSGNAMVQDSPACNHCNATEDVRFLFYNNYRSWQNMFAFRVIQLGDLQSLYSSGYNASLPVKVLVHGYSTAFNTAFPQNVRTAYLRMYEEIPVNIIVVDWSSLCNVLYSQAVRNSMEVGEILGKFLCWLHKSQLMRLHETHVVGQSLGCAVMGKAGDVLKNSCGQLLGRITGLDPARPGFEPPQEGARHLRAEDAAHVEIIHTGGGRIGYGMVSSSGHTDFFVNGGRSQPNCSEAIDFPTCNHVISGSYFSETILYKETSGICACRSGKAYQRNSSCCDTQVVFGEYSDASVRGSFYLNYTLHGSMEGEPSPVLNLPLK